MERNGLECWGEWWGKNGNGWDWVEMVWNVGALVEIVGNDKKCGEWMEMVWNGRERVGMVGNGGWVVYRYSPGYSVDTPILELFLQPPKY